MKLGRNAFSSAWMLSAIFGLLLFFLVGCVPSPSPEVSIKALTSAEKTQLQAKYLADRWRELTLQFPDATKPDSVLVRYVTLSEWPQAYATCVTALGFPAQVSEDGGVTGGASKEQGQAAAVAQYTCDAEYPLDPRFNQPLNNSQLDYLYSYFVDKLSPCLKKAGYSIRSAPSLQTFRDEYATAKSWSPYADVNAGGDAWAKINKRCPQNPSGLYG
jgi:hypothetical protein